MVRCVVGGFNWFDQVPKGDDKTKRNLKIQQNNKFFVESEREREMERHKNHRTIFLAKCLKLNYWLGAHICDDAAVLNIFM